MGGFEETGDSIPEILLPNAHARIRLFALHASGEVTAPDWAGAPPEETTHSPQNKANDEQPYPFTPHPGLSKGTNLVVDEVRHTSCRIHLTRAAIKLVVEVVSCATEGVHNRVLLRIPGLD